MRYFGLEEANRLIPMLTRIFSQLRPPLEKVRLLARELESLQGDGTRDAHAELLREEHDELLEQIRTELRQLEEMGIEVKAPYGLVNFRALLGGRTVYLCWTYGEPAVAHWHELNTGFSTRRPVENPEEFTPSYLS